MLISMFNTVPFNEHKCFVSHTFDFPGKLSVNSNISTNTKYVLYAEAQDNGDPRLVSNVGVYIRIDTFTPSETGLVFYFDISTDTYLNNEGTFVDQLNTVFRRTYAYAVVRRWCLVTITLK